MLGYDVHHTAAPLQRPGDSGAGTFSVGSRRNSLLGRTAPASVASLLLQGFPAFGLGQLPEPRGWVRSDSLPYGLPPTLRALLAESLHSPLASQAAVADALDFAIRMVVEQGPGIRAWRQRQWRLIQRSLRQLSPLATFFEGQRAASAQ